MTTPQPLQDFGRAFQISVTSQNTGNEVVIASNGATPSLRVQFEADVKIGSPNLIYIWQAVVTIYNLSASTANTISSNSGQNNLIQSQNSLDFNDALLMGDVVKISAAYQTTNGSAFDAKANLLYTGNLLQSIGTREGVVDTKLILRCVTNLALTQFNFVSFPRASGQTDEDVLQQIVDRANIASMNLDQESQQALSNQSYSRGQAIFSRPCTAISDICKQHNIFPWVDSDGVLNIRAFGVAATAAAQFTYGPPNFGRSTPQAGVIPTLLGVPEQLYNGIKFRVLMDSNVKLGNTVALAYGTAINAFQFAYNSLPPLPTFKGTYIVAGLRYFGDTRGRGDDWYTEITAMTPQFFSVFQTVNAKK